MTMKRREFFQISGSTIAVATLGGCPKPRGLQARVRSLRDLMAAEVAQNHFPGAVWLVAQGGDVAADAVGVTAIDGSAPMRRDTIFRIA
jgi:CubicO group peptidase (beta-lactamase class C family)